MRADLPERLETLARECSDALMFDGRKALTEAATALRALRDAPVGVMHATTDGGFLVTSQGSHLDLKNGPPIFGQRVRLVADGDTTTGGGAREDDRVLWGVVANAGRLASERKVRWSHVSDATGQGSTRSADLCRRFGFDPNETIGKWPEPEE